MMIYGGEEIEKNGIGSFTVRVPKMASVIMADDLINVKKTFKDFKFNNQINPKDNLLISKSSTFPSLSLSKIENIDVKRVISVDKADKIIIDEIPDFNRNNYNIRYLHRIKVIMHDEETIYYHVSYRNIDEVDVIYKQRYKNGYENAKVYCHEVGMCQIIDTQKEDLEIIINNPDKLISTDQLNDYVNKFLDKITISDIESLKNLMTSSEKSLVRTGIELLNNYNFDDYIYEVLNLLRETNYFIKYYNLTNLISFKNILHQLKISSGILEYYSYELDIAIFDHPKLNKNIREEIKNMLTQMSINTIRSNSFLNKINKMFDLNITLNNIEVLWD